MTTVRLSIIIAILVLQDAHGMALSRAKSMLRVALRLQEIWGSVRDSEPRLNEISRRACAAPSSKHGQGLFACQDLPSGTVASLYPVHALGIGSNRLQFADPDWQWSSKGRPYKVELWHTSLRDWAPQMWIDADPNRCVDGWLGHMANDAAICAAGADEAAILEYYSECGRATNAVMVPFGHECAPLMCVVTTRDVQEGDELLISYGHEYWITRGEHDLSIEEADTLNEKAKTPAVVAAANVFCVAAQVDAVQAAVEAEYAPEIGRFEQVFATAAHDAASKSTEGQDDDIVYGRRAAAYAPEPPGNRRQRRAVRTKKKKKKGYGGGGFGGS